jgi:hypothetical protein
MDMSRIDSPVITGALPWGGLSDVDRLDKPTHTPKVHFRRFQIYSYPKLSRLPSGNCDKLGELEPSVSKSLKKAGIKPQPPDYQYRDTTSGEKLRGMYTWILMEKFKAFERIELSNLARINLLFGPNNSGKSTILEGIFTHASGLNFHPFFSQVVVRRQESYVSGALDMGEKLRSLFRDTGKLPYQFDISAQTADQKQKHSLHVIFRPSAQLSDLDPRVFGQSGPLAERSSPSMVSTNSWELGTSGLQRKTSEVPSVFLGRWKALLGGTEKESDITFPVPSVSSEPPFKLANFHDVLAHRQPASDLRVFSHLKRYGLLSDFVKAMSDTFSEVEDIDMIPYPDGTQGPVYVRTAGERVLPLYAFGDGMRRWYYLLGNMIVSRGAVHCIEEADSMLHPASQPAFCRWLAKYAEEFDNQVFLTTHSIEFADSFLNALFGEGGVYAKNETDPVRVMTIHPNKTGLEVWPLSGREAFEKRQRFELELR